MTVAQDCNRQMVGLCLLCLCWCLVAEMWSEEDAQLSLQTSQAPYIPVEVKHPLWEVKLLMWALVAATNLSSLLSCSSGNSWFLNIRLQVYKNIVWVGALCCLEMSVSVLRKSKRVILLGLGCSKTSVCFIIFSVHCLVLSALIKSFSKWASNSVFSAWPSFSSVNWKIKKICVYIAHASCSFHRCIQRYTQDDWE